MATFGYDVGDNVFVLDPRTKHWLQGVVKVYIPDHKRSSGQPEPAYEVAHKILRRFDNDGRSRHKMVWGRPIIATNGYIKPLDQEPIFEVGQRATIRKNGQRVIVLQALDRPTKFPTYLVFNIADQRKHMIGEQRLDADNT
jgi:hypothetical protein